MADQEFTTQELATEEWRDVPWSKGAYQVSNLGRVRSIRLLSTPAPRVGYRGATLCVDNRRYFTTVHRLVVAAFVGERPPGFQVNHKNGIKGDNRLSNLEYVTPKKNMEHASETGLIASGDRQGLRVHPEKRARGERCGRAKLTEEKVRDIRRRLAQGQSGRQIAKIYNVTGAAVSSISRGKSWRHVP